MATRRIREFLDGSNVKYALISHSPAYTAQEVAASAHVPGKELAKTVMVKVDGVLAMAVVPANREVEMGLLRSAVNARRVDLASVADFAHRFEGCQLGAMPPFGNLFGIDTYVDKDLAKEEYIAFNAGSHTDVIVLRFDDFRRLVRPKLAHISTTPVAEVPPAVGAWSSRSHAGIHG
jgi:Ala-tRNA(Pro) deacylase